jgi:three-Cys-motif partner protein
MPKFFDEVGEWSELKIALIRDYARAYSRIISKYRFTPVYIDGFAGPGRHISKKTGEFILGTPLRILEIEPKFSEYHFIDLNEAKLKELRAQIGSRSDVELHPGDCNEILLERILPGMGYKTFRKGLCFLDPYGMHLDWRVLEMAGKLGTIDLVLNFPIYDMNINALKHDPAKVSPAAAKRLTRFWGDESWRDAAYAVDRGLFEDRLVKLDNDAVVEAFRKRLRDVAGFPFVSKALPMKIPEGAIVYYLIGASPKEAGVKIINDIFNRSSRR